MVDVVVRALASTEPLNRSSGYSGFGLLALQLTVE